MKAQKIKVRLHKPQNKINATESNQKILERYTEICRNKGLTDKSIKAICGTDIPLFLGFINDKRLADITHNDIENFMTYCSSKRHNQPQTVARKYTSLHSFYSTIIKQDLINTAKNPVDKVEKPKVRQKVREYLTIEEYRQLLAYVDEHKDLRGSALLSFLYSSACRVSECWQQNKANLNLDKRQFKVLGKGDKERICVLSKDSVERIKKYLDSRTDDNEALFVSCLDTRWGTRSIQRYVKKLGKVVGITKNVHPHIFRHTRAMFCLKNKMPLEQIQKLLGHSNIATTQIYAHTDIEDVQNVVDELDNKID